MSKVNIGKMNCENRRCDNVVTVKQNENGTLSYRCDECDAAPYARVGTGLHLSWMEQLTPLGKTNEQKAPISDLNNEVDTDTPATPQKRADKPSAVGIWGDL
jgi:hypothetical protein